MEGVRYYTGIQSLESFGCITTKEDSIRDLVLTPAGQASQQDVNLGHFSSTVQAWREARRAMESSQEMTVSSENVEKRGGIVGRFPTKVRV